MMLHIALSLFLSARQDDSWSESSCFLLNHCTHSMRLLASLVASLLTCFCMLSLRCMPSVCASGAVETVRELQHGRGLKIGSTTGFTTPMASQTTASELKQRQAAECSMIAAAHLSLHLACLLCSAPLCLPVCQTVLVQVDILKTAAAKQGYKPDCYVAADEVPHARPYPFMVSADNQQQTTATAS